MPQQPPPEIPVVSLLTPQIVDRLLVDEWNTEKADYSVPQPGTPHPNLREFSGFVFVTQKPSRAEKWVQRFWYNERSAQNTYNASVGFSGEVNAHPIYERSYWERRAAYTPLTKLAALTGVVSARVTAAGSGYTAATAAFSGGAGTGAAATVIVFRGEVVGIIITAEGTGYTSAPAIAIFGDGTGATAASAIQPATAVLTKESGARMEGEPADSLWLRVTRIYETLPGPWIPFTRYDDALGPIQGRRRAVANTGQSASLTATLKTTYEGREGSAIVSWQIEETYTTGGGGAGNPPFPIQDRDFYDEERGAVQERMQVAVRDGTEVGSLTVAGGIATRIRYEPFNEFLLKKITETWAVPGPLRLQSPSYDPERGQITNTIQLVENTSQVGSRTATANTYYRPSSFGAALISEVIEDWSSNMPDRPARAWDDVRGNVNQTMEQVTIAGGEVASLAVVGGTAVTQITYQAIDEYQLRKITEAWTVPGPILRANERYDRQLGLITSTRRIVENTGQVQSASAGGETHYEASPFGAALVWQVLEAWDEEDCPILIEDIYEDERGAVQRVSQLIPAAGSEVGSLAVATGVATQISYEPYNEFLLRKVTETWAVPGTARTGARRNVEVRGRDVAISITPVAAGTAPDNGSTIISSEVVAQNPVISEKRNVTVASLPPNESWAFWDFVPIPVLLFDIDHVVFCNGTASFKVVTNPTTTGGASALRKHRTTVSYSAAYPNPDLSASTFTVRDIRYQGVFIGFSFNNVLNDALSYTEAASTGDCSWDEEYTFSASTPTATAFAAGVWYTRDYRVEPWGTTAFRATHTEFYSAAGNPSI